MFGGVGIFCFIRFSQPLPLGEGPRYMVSFLLSPVVLEQCFSTLQGGKKNSV